MSAVAASAPSTRAPPSLRPFVRALAAFAPDIAQALSSWLPRLALLVGPLARRDDEGGDPDGYDGVARRGPYERLLLSEWATALELPDEFVRRAAMGEHLFVELSRRQPHGALRSLLLADPGPDQLGTPRLVHIAAAIVADARARRLKASFAWGALGQNAMFPAVDVPSVRTLLEARRGTPLDDDVLTRWHHAVARFDGTVDVLFVGGARLERLVARSPFAGASRLLRVDPSLTARALDVTVAGARPARTLRLALPDDPVCVRMLRDPFERDAAPAPAAATLDVVASAGLCVPLGGRRILVRTRDALVALCSPNSPRAALGPARRLPLARGDVLLAAGMAGRRPLALVAGADRRLALLFAGARTELDGALEAVHDVVAPLFALGGDAPADDGGPSVPIPELDGRPRGFLHDGQGFALAPLGRRVTPLQAGFLVPPLAHRGVTLTVRSGDGHVVITGPGGDSRVITGPATRALLGALWGGSVVPGALALETVSGSWLLVRGTGHVVVAPPPGEVVACASHPVHGACLVVVEDERRLVFANDRALERHAFALPIAAVAPDLELPQVAVLTVDGTVTVLFMKTGVRTVVCRGSGA